MPKRNLPGTGSAVARNSIFVDTSAWIALFSRRDQHHTEADRAFRTAVVQHVPLLTTNLVMAEVHRLLLFRAGPEAAAAALARIDDSKSVAIGFPAAEHHAAAREWLRRLGNHRITYTDAASFSFMVSSGCRTVLTYDSDFSVAGFDLARP